MTLKMCQLTLVDLRLIYYNADLAIQIDHSAQIDLIVRVTDTQLCCMVNPLTAGVAYIRVFIFLAH